VDLVAACRDRIWQINLQAKADSTDAGITAALGELETYLGWTRDGGSRLTWTPLVATPGDTKAWRALLDYSTEHAPDLVPQISAQAISAAIRFDGASQAALIDGWAQPFAGYGSLDEDERRALLADDGFRSALRASPQNCARSTGPCFDRWRYAISPGTPTAVGMTLSQYAESVGRHPVDAMLDLALADGLATVVDAPLSNTDDDAVQALVTAPTTIFGIGDAGAHVTSITNYSYPTHVLAVLARDRGWLSVADAVHRLSGQPAAVFGLPDRGRLAEGYRADLCVIDLDRLAVGPAELVSDLPGGARRLHRSATGYEAVVVNGTVTVRRDRLTDDRAGELIRV
jgi:N-acyl-D-aspartate/D-glutamate deacylase